VKDEPELIMLDSDHLDILFGYAFHNDELADPVMVGVAISDEFKQKIIKGYPADNWWSKVIQILQ
jgi:hypothetical protein